MTRPGIHDGAAVRDLYDRIAPVYDLASRPYSWIGTRALADRAMAELRLRRADTVVDLGTGTGRNLLPLAAAVGPRGRVIGVDLSPAMLERARRRAQGLPQVEFVEADMRDYHLPEGTAAVLATYALEMVEEHEALVARLARECRPGGRLVLNGLRSPERWPGWLVRLGSSLSRPFGVTPAYRDLHPWEAVARHLHDTTYAEGAGGAAYLAAGTCPGEGSR